MHRSEGSRTGRTHQLAVRLAYVLALVIGLLPAAAAAQVSVEELELHLQLVGTRTALGQVIPVKNEEDRPQQVRVAVADWYRDSLGRNVFVDAGTEQQSCAARLSVFPVEFQIAPGATELIRVSYDPSESDPGCWSIVFIETVTPPQPNPTAPGSFLTLEIRTGVKIYVHAKDAVKAGEVEAADVALFWRRAEALSTTGDTVQVREAVVRFVNTGTAHYRVRSQLEIRGTDSRLIFEGPGPDMSMTPGAAHDIHLPMPTLPSGDYIAIVLLDFGGAEISAAQIDFRVP
jgi:P pilus assembly chaperone PapD